MIIDRQRRNDRNHIEYFGVSEWPEPNIATAAQHLRTIFEQPAAARATAERAIAFIRDHFSLANFEADVRNFADSYNYEFH